MSSGPNERYDFFLSRRGSVTAIAQEVTDVLKENGYRVRRAAKKGNELAALHYSITSSARPSNASGTVKPSAFAVLRLMTNSNFVGCCTGSSDGFSPLRMRAANRPTWR